MVNWQVKPLVEAVPACDAQLTEWAFDLDAWTQRIQATVTACDRRRDEVLAKGTPIDEAIKLFIEEVRYCI